MPIYTPALDLIVNLADRQSSGRLALSGSRVVAGVSPASSRIVLGDTGLCRVRAVVPNLHGERAFDDVDLSISTVRIALGVPGEVPYCLATLSDPSAVAAAQVTSPQSATADLPATKRITLDPAPYGGSFIVTLDANDPFELPFDAEQGQFQALAGPDYVVRKRAENVWEISGTEANQDVTVTVDSSGLLVPLALSGAIDLNTTALAAAFAAAGDPKWLRVTREVEIDGIKVFQDDKVEIARAVLDLSSLVPTPLPPSDVAAINTALSGKQPVNAALTSISSLLTTAWGRVLLTLADAGALRTYASAQPLNSGLSAISSLSTAGYGRGVLTQPDAAALRGYIGATFANLPDKPTTIAGYGITDFNSLGDARWTQLANLNALGDARWSALGHVHAFADLTSKPTTVTGYGITDFNSLGDARWSALGHTHSFASLTGAPTTIAGYGITDFNSLGDARWSPVGHSHSFASLTGRPTTIAGYGIADAIALTSAANAFVPLQTFNSLASYSLVATQLANPGAPTVTPIGNDEGAAWSYKIVAKLSDGTPTAASPAGTTTHGDQTLDATNKLSLGWTAVPGAVSYDVYRTACGVSPSTTGKIANVLTNAYVDTGAAGDGTTPPAVNNTGSITGRVSTTGGLLNLNYVDVRWYGVDITGATDSTAEFENAQAAAREAGVILFNPGIVKISSGIVINDPDKPEHWFGGTLLWAGSLDEAMVTIDHASAGSLERVRLDGQGNVQDCLVVDSAQHYFFKRLELTGFRTGDGLRVTAGSATCSWITFAQCSFVGRDYPNSGQAHACVYLTGDSSGAHGGGNSCHIQFQNCQLTHDGDTTGMRLGNCDNIKFDLLFIFRGPGGTKPGVYIASEAAARPTGLAFDLLEAGDGGLVLDENLTVNPATIYNYQVDNGQPDPRTNGVPLGPVTYSDGRVTLPASLITNGIVPRTTIGTAAFGFDASSGATIDLANNASAYISGAENNFGGLILVSDITTNLCAMYLFGYQGSVNLIGQSYAAAPAPFSSVAATAGHSNLYWDGTGMKIENKTGAACSYRIVALRMTPFI